MLHDRVSCDATLVPMQTHYKALCSDSDIQLMVHNLTTSHLTEACPGHQVADERHVEHN